MTADVTEDGRYLMIYLSEGGDDNASTIWTCRKPGAKAVPVVDRFDAKFEVMGNIGAVLYVFTNDKAPRGKVITIDLQRPPPPSGARSCRSSRPPWRPPAWLVAC